MKSVNSKSFIVTEDRLGDLSQLTPNTMTKCKAIEAFRTFLILFMDEFSALSFPQLLSPPLI